MNDSVVISIALGILGLAIGSFAGATVWRLRARQLRLDAKHGEKVKIKDKHQVEKLHKKNPLQDRSVCLHCGHTLKWYDLIPLVSWVTLGGKCRYCHKSIGWFEPTIEVGLAVFFVVSYLCWPTPLVSGFDIAQLIIWLVAGAGLAILFAYDARWFLLPNVVVFPLIALGALNALLVLVQDGFAWPTVVSVLSSCFILSGLYYLLYVLSQHKWVGFGDIKLGLALALLLVDWQLALLALFLANLFGTILLLPLLIKGKLKRQLHIPFGPLLISGWAVAGIFGAVLLRWYSITMLGL